MAATSKSKKRSRSAAAGAADAAKELSYALTRLSMRVEVLAYDIHKLSNLLGGVRADMHAGFDRIEARFDAIDGHVESISNLLQRNHASVLEALQKLLDER